jgi:choline-sulfatase
VRQKPKRSKKESPGVDPMGAAPRLRHARLLAAAAVCVAGMLPAGLAWCHRSRPHRRDSLLLVTIDTTRADRLGAYGHRGARTPVFDRLAAEGVRFEWAFTPAPLTLPAHASMLTAVYPPTHGVRNNGFHLEDRFATLATHLGARGYRTGAFVSAFILDRRYGLARGFSTYDDEMPGSSTLMPWGGGDAERRGGETAQRASRWLEKQAGMPGPFFAWLHLYDPHHPYRPPAPFDTQLSDAYDGEIAYADSVLGSVLAALERTGLIGRTIVTVAGDHGESLGEHGEETHGVFVYDEAIRVPWVLWGPGAIPAGVVTEPVRLIDLAPTLLELIGQGALPAAEGRSLVPLVRGRRVDPAPVYAESLLPQLYMNWAAPRAIRDARYKLVDLPRPELYDLAQDPGESQNLYSQKPGPVRALRQQLDRVSQGSEGAMSTGTVDHEGAEKLAALGYIGAVAPAATDGAARLLRDPKDLIVVYNRLSAARAAARARRFAEALSIFEQVLAGEPGNSLAQLGLGTTYMGMQRWDDALNWLRRYAEALPANAFVHQWMAVCHVHLRQPEAALREADAALSVDPRLIDAHALKSGIFVARGDFETARRELEAAVAIDPGGPMMRLNLARVLLASGRLREAEAEYETALSLAPTNRGAMADLAGIRARKGDVGGAEELLRRSLALNDADASVRFNLASILERTGRLAEAEPEYRRLSADEGAPPAVRQAAASRLRSIRAR